MSASTYLVLRHMDSLYTNFGEWVGWKFILLRLNQLLGIKQRNARMF